MAAWQNTQNMLIDSFASLGADKACRDASRILRITGSINSKADARVTLYDCGDTVSITAFQSKVKNTPVKQTYQAKSAKTGKRKAAGEYGKLATLMWARMNDLKAIAAMRGGKLTDHRSMAIFYYAMSASMVTGTTESLLRSVSEFMQQCIECGGKYDHTRPEALLQTVITRHLKKESARAERGDFYGIQYKATNNTIIKNLELTEDEIGQLSTIIDKGEKYRRKNEKRSNVRRSEYEANSLSSKKPWEALGMSRAKWYRLGKPDQIELDV
jgi:restriction endonuclease